MLRYLEFWTQSPKQAAVVTAALVSSGSNPRTWAVIEVQLAIGWFWTTGSSPALTIKLESAGAAVLFEIHVFEPLAGAARAARQGADGLGCAAD